MKKGPNLQAKYLEYAEQLPAEIVAECKEKVIEVWGKVEGQLARRRREEAAAKETADFAELRRRMKARFAEREEASSFLPAKQPPAESEEQSSQEELAPTLIPVSPREPILLNPGAPYDNAQKLITEYHWHTGQRVRTLQHYQKDFWKWDGTHWVQVDDDGARSDVWKQLDAADKIVKGGKRERFEPSPHHVNGTMDALRGATSLPKSTLMPGWFGPAPVDDMQEMVACQNGMLHLPTRRLFPHTPRFWSANVLEFGYDPKAKAPRFEQFLREVWPDDDEAQQSLLEMFGLSFTDITKYHQAFMLVGPPRGGRGTIGRLLHGLIGEENYVGTTLKALSEPFGLESFIGKKVVAFPDARLEGVHPRNLSTLAERLLTITGGDDMHVNRKNAKYWEGKLTARIVLFSNELLRMQDQSGALASRFVVWQMRESFLGREDFDLTDKLLAERPGILNLALEALDRVRTRRPRPGVLQCKTGLDMSQDLADLLSDVKVFIDQSCDIGPQHEVLVAALFARWQLWCAQQGIRHSWGSNQFSAKVVSVVPTIRRGRPRTDGRSTKLLGIGLAKKSMG